MLRMVPPPDKREGFPTATPKPTFVHLPNPLIPQPSPPIFAKVMHPLPSRAHNPPSDQHAKGRGAAWLRWNGAPGATIAARAGQDRTEHEQASFAPHRR